MEHVLYNLTKEIVLEACDDKTLGYLAMTQSYGTMFEVVETRDTFQFVGSQDGKIACRAFNSDEIVLLDRTLKIHRVF
jgi:hypothetical protein